MSGDNINLAVVHFATRLGRFCALTAEESRMLERAIGRKPCTRRWTYADDAKLQRLRRTRMRVPEIAAELGRTTWAVYRRISDLKAGKARVAMRRKIGSKCDGQ